MFLQYEKDLQKLKFKLISPGILSTNMNKQIKALDGSLYPDMNKFHQTNAVQPKKAAELIYQNYSDYFDSHKIEFDLRNEESKFFIDNMFGWLFRQRFLRVFHKCSKRSV